MLATVIVNVCDGPTQPFNVGAYVMVPVIGVLPELVAVNEGIGPIPFAPRPIDVLELAQPKVAPAGADVKFTWLVDAPEQSAVSA